MGKGKDQSKSGISLEGYLKKRNISPKCHKNISDFRKMLKWATCAF